MAIRPMVMGLAACVVWLGAPAGAMAGNKSLIAGLSTGDELRYTFTLSTDETTSMTGKVGAGTRSTATETVGILVRVKADTKVLDIVEIVYESFRISMDTDKGKVEMDLAGPEPDAQAPPRVRDVYAKLHGLVGTVITINVTPGSGEITTAGRRS